MRFKLEALPCSRHTPLVFVPSSSCLRKYETARATSLVLSNPFVSNAVLKCHAFSKISRGHTIRRSCSSNLDDIKESTSQVAGLGIQQTSFSEPMMVGIRPEWPGWLDQEMACWAVIEQKAKSLDIPLSLRMIKKKLQCEEGCGCIDVKDSSYCSMKAAFASMVYIVVELQTHALHMREALCHEDLEIISSKVQKDMHSSFVWLFQQVFSRTPPLMLHLMVLLANFSAYSASAETHAVATKEDQIQHIMVGSVHHSNVHPGSEDRDEMKLWKSMTEGIEDEVLDHKVMQYLVSPVSVDLEPDDYEVYLRTDLLYQMILSQEPNNPLLLCNYAQFLHLVAHDYYRAEECFKRAVQVMPQDAESLNRYANFLWTVRRDFMGAEERFLQALSVEPDNPYYASRYANFLWSTGGEETCFPLNHSHETNS